MGKVVAVANQKGGVGKTTTAVSLAACIAAAEKPTLLIDMDPQANCSSSLNIKLDEVKVSVYDILANGRKIEEALVPSELPYLKIVPAGMNLYGAEVELMNVPAKEHCLAQAIMEVKKNFAYILIDCPPSLGLLTLNALTSADSVLVPVQCEYLALEGLARLMQVIELVKQNFNPALQLEGVVLTMATSRTTLSQQVSAEVKKFFNTKVYNTVIPRNVRLSEAPSYGKPIILYDIRSAGAAAYLNLAKEFLERGN